MEKREYVGISFLYKNKRRSRFEIQTPINSFALHSEMFYLIKSRNFTSKIFPYFLFFKVSNFLFQFFVIIFFCGFFCGFSCYLIFYTFGAKVNAYRPHYVNSNKNHVNLPLFGFWITFLFSSLSSGELFIIYPMI